MLPTLIAHADWSVSPAKRWLACAARQPDGTYWAKAPEPAGPPETLLDRLSQQAGDGPLLAGFDFPIGVPQHFARQARITSFLEFLSQLGAGRWLNFYHPAEDPEQVCPERPFYPRHAGHARQAHLLAGLNTEQMNDLRRQCELSHPGRRSAAPLFWTMGSQQVGKAAITGWQDLLQPAVRRAELCIWPFHGPLAALLKPGARVAAETYPAEFYLPLGIRFLHASGGKRSQAARASNSKALLTWAAQTKILLAPGLNAMILDGFGASSRGEDAFDAVAGLFGMIAVASGVFSPGDPADPVISTIEGWILGQRNEPDSP